MSETTEFIIGAEVVCSDGISGDLRRIVVDPVDHTVTHLVVEPKHGPGMGRLVPIDLVKSSAPQIAVRCAISEFDALEAADEMQCVPGAGGQWGFGQEFGFRMGGMGMGIMGPGPQAITSDRIPPGEVEVRRGDHVHASDGTIGRLQGLVIDGIDHQVTEVLIDAGHLWGEKRIAIPISAVTGVDNGIYLNLTKDEVRDLLPVGSDHSA